MSFSVIASNFLFDEICLFHLHDLFLKNQKKMFFWIVPSKWLHEAPRQLFSLRPAVTCQPNYRRGACRADSWQSGFWIQKCISRYIETYFLVIITMKMAQFSGMAFLTKIVDLERFHASLTSLEYCLKSLSLPKIFATQIMFIKINIFFWITLPTNMFHNMLE